MQTQNQKYLNNERKRIYIDVSKDQKQKLEKYFKWGELSPFLRFVIDDLLEIMDSPENARLVIGTYIRRRIGLRDVSPELFGEVKDVRGKKDKDKK